MAEAIPTRPLLRWHGGKWMLAPWIVSHFPKHRVYIEPFGGAASVLLRKPRVYAELYNDLDGDVVNLFRVVRDQGEELVRALSFTPFSREEFELSYGPVEDPLERARRLVVRSFMGHGSNSHHRKSGFRAKAWRSNTVPAYDWMNYPAALKAVVGRLRGVVVECKDAREVMAYHDSEQTLHYVDPPYLPDTRDGGSDYNHEMTAAEHSELAEFLGTLKGKVCVSGYPSDLYEQLYAGWNRVHREAMADGAKARTEVLWMNYKPAQRGLF